jgi:hypothetical protein
MTSIVEDAPAASAILEMEAALAADVDFEFDELKAPGFRAIESPTMACSGCGSCAHKPVNA